MPEVIHEPQLGALILLHQLPGDPHQTHLLTSSCSRSRESFANSDVVVNADLTHHLLVREGDSAKCPDQSIGAFELGFDVVGVVQEVIVFHCDLLELRTALVGHFAPDESHDAGDGGVWEALAEDLGADETGCSCEDDLHVVDCVVFATSLLVNVLDSRSLGQTLVVTGRMVPLT